LGPNRGKFGTGMFLFVFYRCFRKKSGWFRLVPPFSMYHYKEHYKEIKKYLTVRYNKMYRVMVNTDTLCILATHIRNI